MRWSCLLLLPILLLPGCIFQKGGPDDLGIVCEIKSGSPGPAFTTDGLVAATAVGPELSADSARSALNLVRLHVLTLGRHAPAQFHANLTQVRGSEWRFTAEGRNATGALLDDYNLTLQQVDKGWTVTETRPSLGDVAASPSMIRKAISVVNATTELSGIPARTPTLVATGWDPYIPSCVRLLYQDGPADAIISASPEHPQTTVVVSLVSDRVVLIKRDGWTA